MMKFCKLDTGTQEKRTTLKTWSKDRRTREKRTTLKTWSKDRRTREKRTTLKTWSKDRRTREKRTAEPQNNEPQNVEGWFRCAQSIFIKWEDFLQHHIVGAAVYPCPQCLESGERQFLAFDL